MGIEEELQTVLVPHRKPNAKVPLRFVHEATNSLNFVKNFDNAFPTTCCYQRVHMTDNDIGRVKSHYYFVMEGLSSTFRIFNGMTLTFCGSIFQHNTSVPAYTRDNDDGSVTLWMGKHPDITWLAWGSSKNGSNKRKRSSGKVKSSPKTGRKRARK